MAWIVNRILFACAVAPCLFSASLSAAPQLSLDFANATSGETAVIPVTLESDGDAVAVQFDIHYDAARLTPETASGGNALVGHAIDSEIISPGTLRILTIPPPDNAVLGSGVIATVPFTVDPDASSGSTVLSPDNVMMSDVATNDVQPVATAEGLIADPTNSSDDQDSDGIPDGWEIQYGLDPFDAGDANEDPDGDGTSNLEEYQQGTDPGQSQTGLSCNDLPVTMVGTAQRDVMSGTPGADVIHGLGGNDVIEGAGGNDVICGGEGDDTLDGQGDNDTLLGQEGDDTLMGGSGDDAMQGGTGIDRLIGDSGHDELFGDAGDDRLYGDIGNDTLDGGAGSDSCDGSYGTDSAVNCEQVTRIP